MSRTAQQSPRSMAVTGQLELTLLEERFLKRPGLNANQDPSGSDTYNTAQAILIVDKNHDFEILGTNMTSALVTFAATGGITLTTAGASADQGILLPHLNTGASQWTGVQWNSDQTPTFETVLVTGANITAVTLWAGYKLTNTPVVATDNDQAFFRYDDTVNSGRFQCVASNNGTDVVVDSGISVAVSTQYHLRVEIDSDHTVHFMINGNEVVTIVSGAKAAVTGLIPYVGIMANASAAKALTVRGIRCSRL